MEKLTESIVKNDKPTILREKIYDKNLKINETINNMIGDIDGMIEGIADNSEE